MPFVNRTAWVVEAEDDVQCSASADTVVIQSDDEDPANSHIVFAGTLEDMSRKASGKKAAAMCEACDEGIVTVATCLSGNQKLCEMCDLAEWAAGLCSSCGDMPVTRDQKNGVVVCQTQFTSWIMIKILFNYFPCLWTPRTIVHFIDHVNLMRAV